MSLKSKHRKIMRDIKALRSYFQRTESLRFLNERQNRAYANEYAEASRDNAVRPDRNIKEPKWKKHGFDF